MVGEISAVCTFNGETVLSCELPSTDAVLPSENVMQLKAQATTFMTNYLKQHNMSVEEVDVMEEVISDTEADEAAGSGKGKRAKKGGQKRKASPGGK